MPTTFTLTVKRATPWIRFALNGSGLPTAATVSEATSAGELTASLPLPIAGDYSLFVDFPSTSLPVETVQVQFVFLDVAANVVNACVFNEFDNRMTNDGSIPFRLQQGPSVVASGTIEWKNDRVDTGEAYKLIVNEDTSFLEINVSNYSPVIYRSKAVGAHVRQQGYEIPGNMSPATFSAFGQGALHPEWIEFTALFDQASGRVYVPISAWFTVAELGQKLNARVFVKSPARRFDVAIVELTLVRDLGKSANGDTMTWCRGDNAITLRLRSDANDQSQASVSESKISPFPIAGGESRAFTAQVRSLDEDLNPISNWSNQGLNPTELVRYEPALGIIDFYISGFTYVQIGDLYEYRIVHIDSETVITTGKILYAPQSCAESPSPRPGPISGYAVQANDKTKYLRFRLVNYSPDPSQAVASLIVAGDVPSPLSQTTQDYIFEYAIDDSDEWNAGVVRFDGSRGIAEVHIEPYLSQADSQIRFRLLARGDA